MRAVLKEWLENVRLGCKWKTRKLSLLVHKPEVAEGCSSTKACSLCSVNMMVCKAYDTGKIEKNTKNPKLLERNKI